MVEAGEAMGDILQVEVYLGWGEVAQAVDIKLVLVAIAAQTIQGVVAAAHGEALVNFAV